MFNTMVAEHLIEIAEELKKDDKFLKWNKSKREVSERLRSLAKDLNEFAELVYDE